MIKPLYCRSRACISRYGFLSRTPPAAVFNIRKSEWTPMSTFLAVNRSLLARRRMGRKLSSSSCLPSSTNSSGGNSIQPDRGPPPASPSFNNLTRPIFGPRIASARSTRELCMSLSIEIRQIDYVVVMELAGRLSVLESSLRQCAWELIERGERYFVINLANVSYLDNSGLGQLCWVYTVVRNRGG